MERLGFIGIGLMGSRMTTRLLAAGYPVRAWNRSPEKCAPLAALGAVTTASLAEMAEQCDVLLLCLSDTAAVEAVVFGEDGLSDHLRQGQLLVDFSSITPDATRDFASGLSNTGRVTDTSERIMG